MKFKTLSNKIWFTMMVTLFLVILLAVVVNITVLSNVRQEVVIDQLKDVAEAKMEREAEHQEVWAPHFSVKQTSGKKTFSADPYSMKSIDDPNDEEAIMEAVDALKFNGQAQSGKVGSGPSTMYYYAEPFGNHQMMLYVQFHPQGSFHIGDVFIALAIVFIISFVISRIVARSIVKPLNQLVDYADDVAGGNWEREIPELGEDEIGDLARSLDSMKIDLRTAFDKEREFLQNASHDLKTPVMVIKGYAQASLDGMNVASEEDSMKTIYHESERLEHRVKQLLDYSALDQLLKGDDSKQMIRLDRLLMSLKKQMTIVAPNLQFDITVEEVEVLVNPDAMRIALENVFQNQVQYAKSLVKISLSQQEDIEISFFNDGQAIDEALIAKIFEHGIKSKDGNHGLGLSITKKVIEASKGHISVANVENGVTFTIILENA